MDRRSILKSAVALALLAAPGAASAQGTVKIGVILPLSGQFADLATQMDNGIKLYMKQKGDTVAGKKIEIIRKDSGGVAPDVATRLAQELITRDNVDILAGLLLSPNTIAVSKVAAEAKKFTGDHERGDDGDHHHVALFGARLHDAAVGRPRPPAPGPTRAASARPTRWCPTSRRARTQRLPSRKPSRRPAARSWARCACRSPTRTSRPSCSAPRTSIRSRSSSSCPAGAQPAALGKAFAERGVDRQQDQDHRHRRGRWTRARCKNMGDAALGIIVGVALRLQRRVQAE